MLKIIAQASGLISLGFAFYYQNKDDYQKATYFVGLSLANFLHAH